MKHIEEIHIADFAPFKDFSVKCGDVNLIVGDNDSGKTRLLEWLETEPPNYYNAEAAWWVNSEANITHNWEYIFDYTPHCKIRLVDEMERNGLHWSKFEGAWQHIFAECVEKNLQIFVATHSWDCVTAFAKVACEYEGRLEGVCFRLGQSALDRDNGKIIARSYEAQQLAALTKEGVEVR
jgi:predicted ATP-dependent endonuclease of OLD family